MESPLDKILALLKQMTDDEIIEATKYISENKDNYTCELLDIFEIVEPLETDEIKED